VQALRARGLLDSTLIIVTAKHGDTPIDPKALQYADLDLIPRVVNSVQPGLLAHADQDGTVALIWLTDHSRAGEVARALEAKRAEGRIQQVYSGESLLLRFNDPRTDSRMPDIIVQPQPGVIYTDAGFIAEHGGFSEDDTHVALLVSLPSYPQRKLQSPVRTAQIAPTQIAPTLLQALGLEPSSLDAVRLELTPMLPGLGFPPGCARPNAPH
jgi:arylsulfatase A-like enzyme